jgi:hypothetical protein
MDECHPSVMAWKTFKNGAVKNKGTKNLLASQQGMVQCRVVIRA